MQEKSREKRVKQANLRKKQASAYMKYSGMAFQMGITIGVFSYLGKRLDAYFETTTAYWTAGLALLGVVLALYLLLKDVLGTQENK